jgi:hypothetical protein
MTNDNRQVVSFPFHPHLARYLFFLLTNDVEEDEEYLHRYLDVKLNSIDGRLIRLILERADFPGIKEVKKGFRFKITVPRKTWRHSLFESGRTGELVFSEEAVKLINELYQTRFETDFLSFVCGSVHGKGHGGLKSAILKFIEVYKLEDTSMNYEALKKMYQRTNSPLKKPIYAKRKSVKTAKETKDTSKDLINKYIKKMPPKAY